MGCGADEELNYDEPRTPTDFEEKVCLHFDINYDEWLALEYDELEKLKNLYRAMGKK